MYVYITIQYKYFEFFFSLTACNTLSYERDAQQFKKGSN